MIKLIVVTLILFLNAFANPTILQKQNVLYVQKLIENEEAIAKAFEKYLLNEFKIPTIKDLLDNKYLGSNFSLENIMGENLKEDYKIDKKLPYAITKEIYQNSDNSYIKALYNRDLYRDRTYVVDDENYINIEFKSEEAKNIFNILYNGDEIKKDCSSFESKKFCSTSIYLRYYTTSSPTQYIEFSKKDFLNGNVSISSLSNFDIFRSDKDGKFQDLKIGSYLYDENIIYVKFSDDDILEVK